MATTDVILFIGNIIHCPEKFKIELLEHGFLIVQGGKIIAVGEACKLDTELERLKLNNKISKVQLKKSQILIPGLVDGHIHAPQYPNAGLGYDKTLLDWLDSYTFKLEKKYKDLDLAAKVFEALVKKTLDYGTTTACYFGSLFLETNLVLVDSIIKYGQRAFVGKVNMTKSLFSDYVETEQQSLENTTKFVEQVASKKNDLIQVAITPRFALSVDLDLLTKLAHIANANNLIIQTHISENLDEIKLVKEIYNMSYANAYDAGNILTKKTILAHGIYLSEDELELISKRGSSIIHCPSSNTCLKSGLCDVRRLLNFNVKVGLGTDISGGPIPSIIQTMRDALGTSVHLSFTNDNYNPLGYADVFYLATLGGAETLNLENQIGNFRVGKDFDALIIDVDSVNTNYLLDCTPLEVLQKFIYCGDDRNVIAVYVAGRNVKSRGKSLFENGVY